MTRRNVRKQGWVFFSRLRWPIESKFSQVCYFIYKLWYTKCGPLDNTVYRKCQWLLLHFTQIIFCLKLGLFFHISLLTCKCHANMIIQNTYLSDSSFFLKFSNGFLFNAKNDYIFPTDSNLWMQKLINKRTFEMKFEFLRNSQHFVWKDLCSVATKRRIQFLSILSN